MQRNHIEEITLIMCEHCYDIIIEDEILEVKGLSCCLDCVFDMEVLS